MHDGTNIEKHQNMVYPPGRHGESSGILAGTHTAIKDVQYYMTVVWCSKEQSCACIDRSRVQDNTDVCSTLPYTNDFK